MIGFSTIDSDSDGFAMVEELPSRSTIYELSARVNRTATLDGGAVVDHLGYSDGDREFRIVCQYEEAVFDRLLSMFKNQTFVNLATRDGFFYGVISALKMSEDFVTVTFLPKEREDA